MALASAVIIGIDLGTTFSVVATVGDRGAPTIVANGVGEATTRSEVYFETASSVLIGSAARDAAAVDPDNAVALVKRRMGTECELRFHGVAHTPESVSALILRGLVDAAAERLGTDGPARAVITVPAYFGIREREATLQAARLAGIDVLELLAEPVAAALHYGSTAPGRTGAVLVYDLGGGTFDTTVLRIDAAGVTVVATDGDSELGGADWDERVADHLAELFSAAVGGEVDIDEDESFPHQCRVRAEEIKRTLSTATSRDVRLRCAGRTATVTLDRVTLDRITEDLLLRTTAIVARTLAAAADQGVRRVSEVILVGGATRMPAVAAALTEQLGMVPRLVEPDFAVALGAAARAHQLATDRPRSHGGTGAPTASVVPRSLGILVDDSFDPDARRQFVRQLVHRNDPLPASGTAEFATIVPDQDRIRIQVFEQAGEVPSDDVTHNRRVLDGEFRVEPGLPAGSPVVVTLHVSTDGLIEVSARDRSAGATFELTGYVDGVVDASAAHLLRRSLSDLTIRQ